MNRPLVRCQVGGSDLAPGGGLGTATGTATLSMGKGTCSIGNTALSAGSYSVAAAYAGDANLNSSSATCSTKLTVT
jgi:hypothetical protein